MTVVSKWKDIQDMVVARLGDINPEARVRLESIAEIREVTDPVRDDVRSYEPTGKWTLTIEVQNL